MATIKKIALAVLGISFTACASAAEIDPSWYVQANVKGLHQDSVFGIDRHGYGAGLGFGKALDENWDIQLGTSYGRVRANGEQYQQNLFGADALYFLSRGDLRPFLLMGAGISREKLSGVPSFPYHDTSPYINGGLGLQAQLSDQWSFQADVRVVQSLRREIAATRPHNVYASLGLNYSFGKPAAPAIPVPAPAPVAEPPQVVAPPPPPPPAPAPPPPPARFEKVTMSATELFAFNQATLKPDQSKLNEIAALLNNYPDVDSVVISGYADRIGTSKYNHALSQRRANAVKDYLVAKGVDARRLNTVGKGEENPVVTCTNKKRADLTKCLEPNRRVEVEQITVERRVP